MKLSDLEKTPAEKFTAAFHKGYAAERQGFKVSSPSMPTLKAGESPESVGMKMGRAQALEDLGGT